MGAFYLFIGVVFMVSSSLFSIFEGSFSVDNMVFFTIGIVMHLGGYILLEIKEIKDDV